MLLLDTLGELLAQISTFLDHSFTPRHESHGVHFQASDVLLAVKVFHIDGHREWLVLGAIVVVEKHERLAI